MIDLFGGGMLTGDKIEKEIYRGNISITPYNKEQLNPNSYNLRLSDELLIYEKWNKNPFIFQNEKIENYKGYIQNSVTVLRNFPSIASMNETNSILDLKKENKAIKLKIPEEGYILYPGVLYLGRTIETTASDKYIPMINGRSSGGRLGISIHVCAGFGDIGFDGTWTLEITVIEPVRIYPNTEIAQVCYFKPYGKYKDFLYRGRYYKQHDATPSRFERKKVEYNERYKNSSR